MTTEADPVETFRQEAVDLLESLELSLLDLTQRPDDLALVDCAFRALHTIKGSGAMFGFDQVAAFTHDFETAFDLIRKGSRAASQDVLTIALAAKDYIRILIEDPGSSDPIIGESLVQNLRDALQVEPTNSTKVPAVVEPSSALHELGFHIAFKFHPDVLRNGTNPLVLLDDLRALGPCNVTAGFDDIPTLHAVDPETAMLSWTVELNAPCRREDIEDVFLFVRDDMTLEIRDIAESLAEPEAPVLGEAPAAEGKEQKKATATAPRGADKQDRRGDEKKATVRVPAERLDELMDRVGELVIAQARLSQLASSGTDLAIKSIAEEIERLASGLRDSTMGARMVPMGSLFSRFRRLVHDLSRDLGKPIDFVTEGEETELDKTMIERLADPLVHLIRNAVDHGIESPDARTAKGKSATGRIKLAAHYVGAQVLVTVTDDGGGLDTARIRAKAEEIGLLAPGAAATDAEIHQMMFHPGFSTAKTISPISGRGVGMDVVKRTIESMRGTIDLSTESGKGSKITLRLPLTLAIIDGLLIRVGTSRYIIPLSAVEECVELSAADETRSRHRSFLNLRGSLVPFLKLRALFGVEEETEPHQKVIVTQLGEMRIGLVVDQIIGNHQTVIKSLSKLHADVTMFSGATILGDGTVALILDVAQLAGLQPRPDQVQEAA